MTMILVFLVYGLYLLVNELGPWGRCGRLQRDIEDTLNRFRTVKGSDPVKNQLVDDLLADLDYSKLNKRPELFERFAPEGVKVPLVYINGQGFNVHPTNAMNLATEALLYRRNWTEFHDIMGWMLRYLEQNGNASFFNFYFRWEKASIPWNSSLCQGIAAGYYAIAYKKFKDPRFLKAAQGLVNSFLIDQKNGGFVTHTPYGKFYLEYSNAPDDLVLNGFMLSLKGLTLYNALVGNNISKLLIRDGLATLHKILPMYDDGEWSLYSLKHGRADENYHRLHIRLLYFLGKWYDDKFLLGYAIKWDNYLTKKSSSELPRAKQEYRFWSDLVNELRG